MVIRIRGVGVWEVWVGIEFVALSVDSEDWNEIYSCV